jgi:hypothetical protein
MSYIIIDTGIREKFSEFTNLKNLKCSLSLKEGQKQDILTMSGTISFYSTDFKRVLHYLNVGIYSLVFELFNDLDISQGTGLILFQEGYDFANCIAELKVVSKAKYEKIYKNIATEFNFLEGNLPKKAFEVTTEIFKLEFSQNPFQENGGIGSLWYDLGYPIYISYSNPIVPPYEVTTNFHLYARQSYQATTAEVKNLVGTSGWQLKDGTTHTLIRDWVGYFDAPDITTTNIYEDTIIKLSKYTGYTGIELQDIIEPINSQVLSPDTNVQFPNTIEDGFSTYTNIGLQVNNNGAYKYGVGVYLNNSYYYPSTYHYFTNAYILGDVIKWLIGQIDDSILVYESGISFFWLWDSNIEFKYLRIIDLASLLVQINGSTYTPSFIVKLSLQSILDWLKNDFGADWYIEDVSNLFIIKQFKNFTKEVSSLKNHDLTNINGFNISEDCSDIIFNNSNRYDRIVKKTTAGGIDFVGKDIVFSSISEVNIKTDINEIFYVDLTDIINFPSRYNEQSQNQFCVVCLNEGVPYGVVKSGVGILSGKTLPNIHLSISWLQENLYFSRMSDNTVMINGYTKNIGDEYLEKFREIKQEFFVPCRDFLNDFNLTQYVKTDLSDNCEIISIDYLHEFDKVLMKLKY